MAQNKRARIAALIASKRRRKGWSQSDLARQIGRHRNVVVALEDPEGRAWHGFQLLTRQRVARALDLTAAELALIPPARPMGERYHEAEEAP